MRVVRRQPQDEPTFNSKDWLWLVWVVAGSAVVCLVVGWLATRAGTTSRPASSTPVAAAAAPVPPAPLPPSEPIMVGSVGTERPDEPEERTLSHYDAVRMTVRDLREHARRDSKAPDALSEERIKAIEARGAVID